MRPMTVLSHAAFLALVLAVANDGALAQEKASPKAQPSRSANTQTGTASAKVAPHRQPRAADVPNDPSTPQESDEDRVLNQKLKGICRGC